MEIDYTQKLGNEDLNYFMDNFRELSKEVSEKEFDPKKHNPYQLPYNYENAEECMYYRKRFTHINKSFTTKMFKNYLKNDILHILMSRFNDAMQKDKRFVITQQTFCNFLGINYDSYRSNLTKTEGGKAWRNYYIQKLQEYYAKPDISQCTGSRFAVPYLFRVDLAVEVNQPLDDAIVLNEKGQIIL